MSFSLNELEESRSRNVWVLNKTNPRGIVNFMVDSNGRRVNVTIPLTWVPFDLSTRVTKQALVDNPQFRRMVSAGMLELLSDEQAAKALESEEAREELRKVNGYESSIQSMTPNIPREVRAEVDTKDISGFLLAVASNKDASFKDSLAEIRRKTDKLSDMELKYLADNALNAELRGWASEQMKSGS